MLDPARGLGFLDDPGHFLCHGVAVGFWVCLAVYSGGRIMETPGHCQQELIGLLQILRYGVVFGQDPLDP